MFCFIDKFSVPKQIAMDSNYNSSIGDLDDSYDDVIISKNSNRKGDISISEQLANFNKMRISALTKAAELSPYVKEVTIGPNSPINKNTNRDEVDCNTAEEESQVEDLIEDKLRNDLRYTLIMKEYNAQFEEKSDRLFKNLVENMIAKRVEVMSDYWKKQAEECQRRAQDNKIRKLQLLRDLHNNDNLNVLEQAKHDEQKSQMINRQTLENMNKILEEQNKATARFASITDSQTKICICYNEISNILNVEPLGHEVCNKYITAINTVIGNINTVMEMCKTGAVTDKEVKQSEILALNIENIRQIIVDQLNIMKQDEIIQKQKAEDELLLKELEKKKAAELQKAQELEAQQALKAATKSAKSPPMFYSPKNYNYFKELRIFLDQYEAQYKDLLENPNLKKFRFDCQKAVNIPVNALSSVSGLHIRDKFDKLSKLLKGETVQVLDAYVTATQHPQGLAYCTALLAKKIVRQGDLLVSSNPDAAFAVAAVTVALWSQFPHFGKLLDAYFHELCPYLVPMFLPLKEGQTDKEFYMSRGYTYNDEGAVEKQDKFLKRMSGIFRLRCAIWIAKMPKFINTPNPNSLQYGWQWLTSFINLKPEPDVCATLLHDFFIVCGSECMKKYRKQFIKVIKLVSTDYLGILQNIDEGGPKTRLEVFLQNVLKVGNIDPPSGQLPQNTW